MVELRRRLMAILAADAAGYTRLMAADDDATVRALVAARELFRAHISAQGGRVIDTAGDSVLAVFDSAAAAVQAAQMIQQQLRANLRDVAVDRQLQFRIGIHLGDVIERPDATVYGDGINIAARLQTLADPGGIFISQAIRDAVRGRIATPVTDMGEQEVKNVSHPVRAYRIDANAEPGDASRLSKPKPLPGSTIRRTLRTRIGLIALVTATGAGIGVSYHRIQSWWDQHALRKVDMEPSQAKSSGGPLSIAVLPFSHPEGDYVTSRVSNGLTTSVSSALTHITGAFVVNAETALGYRDKLPTARKLGEDLGVRFVVTGSVQRNADQIRINVQLSDATSDEVLWTQTLDGNANDLFALQDRATRRVQDGVDRELALRALRASEAHNTEPTTSDLLAQANAFDHMAVTVDSLEKVEAIYRQVLTREPNNKRAQGKLAEWLSIHVVSHPDQIERNVREKMLTEALALAKEVSRTDPDNWGVNLVQGNAAEMHGDWDGAAQAWEANVAHHSGIPESYEGLASIYILRGEPRRALEVLKQGMASRGSDPSENQLLLMATAELMDGNNDAAIEWALKAKKINPRSDDPTLAMAYALRGDKVKAAAAVAEVLSVNPKFRRSSWDQVLPADVVMRPSFLDYQRRVLDPAMQLAGFPE